MADRVKRSMGVAMCISTRVEKIARYCLAEVVESCLRTILRESLVQGCLVLAKVFDGLLSQIVESHSYVVVGTFFLTASPHVMPVWLTALA